MWLLMVGLTGLTDSFAQINEQDSLALVGLYNELKGENWTNNEGWLEGNVSTWFGVVVDNNRVVEVSLVFNQLTGEIPDLSNLTQVTSIDLSHNTISGKIPNLSQNTKLTTLSVAYNSLMDLPDLSGTSIQFLDVSNNRFEFDDLEPNITIPNFVYGSQIILANNQIINKRESEPLMISKVVPGNFNEYSWTFNSVIIPDAEASSFEISFIDPQATGEYQLLVTNSLVSGLTLRYPVTDVYVVKDGLFEWKQNIFSEGERQAASYGGFWADIDKDGDEDVFINNYNDPISNYLFINNGDGTFLKLDQGNIVEDLIESRSVSWGDINNDGFPDLFVGAYSGFIEGSMDKSVVYRNRGDLTFDRITIDEPATGGVWGDVDNDGFLDLAINNDVTNTKIYLNNGDNTMLYSGFDFPSMTTWATSFIDIDNDNDLDFFHSDASSVLSYLNLYTNNGGIFTALDALDAPVGLYSRGASWADFDNDGDLDLLVLRFSSASVVDSYFYINEGNGGFNRKSFSSIAGDVLGYSRASVFGDTDNDGDLDLFVIGRFKGWRACFLFENANGAFQLVPKSIQAFPGVSPFSQTSMADYDNDGFLDIFISGQDQDNYNYLLRNKGNANSWIKIKLVGNPSNNLGIGSRIEIRTNNQLQSRQVMSQSGLSAQSSMIAHFGVGSAAVIDEIKVYWPSGNITTLESQKTNRLLTIEETPTVTKVENVLESENLHIYPNPVTDKLSITSQNDASFEIVNTLGQIIISGHITTVDLPYEIDFSGVPNGLYTVIVTENQNSRTIRIVKN